MIGLGSDKKSFLLFFFGWLFTVKSCVEGVNEKYLCGCKVSQAFQSKPQSFDGEPNKKILFFFKEKDLQNHKNDH